MTAMKDAAAEFLGHKRVAVTGVSRETSVLRTVMVEGAEAALRFGAGSV